MTVEINVGQVVSILFSTTALSVAYNLGRRQQRIEGAIRALITTVKDEGERRAIEAGFMARNSDPRPNYQKLREIVAQYGRPRPAVIAAIGRIAADKTLDEDWKIISAIAQAFTADQLQRAYEIHAGGDAMAANGIFLSIIHQCRERGTEAVLRDAGLID